MSRCERRITRAMAGRGGMTASTHGRESKKLRRTLGCFATGIAVVTTKDEHTPPSGMTINSFSSVSLDPPLILWSLSRDSARLDIFQKAEYFAINILAEDQLNLCQHFSSTKSDLFTNIAWQPSAQWMMTSASVRSMAEREDRFQVAFA